MVCIYPLLDLGILSIQTFSLTAIMAAGTCMLYYELSSRFSKCMQRMLYKTLPWMMAGAIIAGRILFALSSNGFCLTGMRITNFGGFVFYGGLLGGLLGLFGYFRGSLKSVLEITDVICTLLPLGQAIGRLGCYFNGCCYGREWSGFLAIPYLLDKKWVYVFPTWFVEIGACTILFLVLRGVSKDARPDLHTAVYACGYSTIRFLLEFVRGDQIRGKIGALSISQWIGFMFIAFGVYAFCRFRSTRYVNVYFR